MDKWQKRHFERANTVASWSKDPSTKVGCVAVAKGKYQLMDGFNGLPDYLDDDDPKYWKRPQKYDYVEHAASNMVEKMHDFGIKAEYDLYLNWFPCPICMRKIISNGCKNVFCDLRVNNLKKSKQIIEKFKSSFEIASKKGIGLFYTSDMVKIEEINEQKLYELIYD